MGYHSLVYADDDYLFAESICTIKKNTEALLNAGKEICLGVNMEKIRYILVFHHQHAGQNHNIKIANKSSENVADFRCLGMALTNQNCIHKEINRWLKSGSVFYHSVQSCLLVCSQKS